MKKIVSLMVAVLMCTGLFAGCTQTQAGKETAKETGKEVAIKFFGFKTGNEIGAIPQLLEKFQNENPGIKVEYEAIPTSSGYNDVIKSRLAADEPVDVFMGQSTNAALYTAANYVEDLSDEKWVSTLTDTMRSIVTFNGGVYSMPIESSGIGMFCNLTLLKNDGLNVPKNWEEFMSVCQALKDKKITPIVMGDKTAWHSFRFMLIYGGLEALTNPNFANDIAEQKVKPSAAFMPILEKINYINQKGYTNAAESLGMQWNDQAFTEFIKGKNAFLFGGTWQTQQLRDANAGFDFSFVPIPVQNGGEASAYVSAGTVLYVNKKTKNMVEAKKFLDFLADDKNLGQYVKSQNGYTVIKGGTSTEDATATAFNEAIKAGRTITFPSGLEFADNLSAPFQKGVQGIIAGTATPEQVGKEMDSALVKAISLK